MIDDPRAVVRLLCAIGRLIRTLIELISTVVRYSIIRHRPAQALAAENLFLRKQLALFRGEGSQADSIVACDFFVSVTATFKILYVFVVIEHATRKILHCNVTAHPSGEWTLQQLREAIPSDHEYRFLIRDRDRKFPEDLDPSIRHLGYGC